MPARSSAPRAPVLAPCATAYTPLQMLFLSRLAHLAALCYRLRDDLADSPQRALLHHALCSTIDDCFAAGLAHDLLTLLAEELSSA